MSLRAAEKAQKHTIGGAGVNGLGVVQQTGVTTSGQAFTMTAWSGKEVVIHVTGTARYRWSATTSTTIETTTATSAASPLATGGGLLYSGQPNYRDVPWADPTLASEGVFLVIQAVTGTVDVHIEASS